MAKESESLAGAASLEALQAAMPARGGRSRPPVHLWNPPFCGDIDMRIARDGTWFYNGTPIGRPALVQLFASVLRHEGGKHVLVTPVEKVGLTVEDAPFLAVEMRLGDDGRGQVLHFRTNLDEWTRVDAAHPLRFEPGASGGLKPYVLVRDELWALVKRALFYDLVDRGEVRTVAGRPMFGVVSAGSFFAMAPADELDFTA